MRALTLILLGLAACSRPTYHDHSLDSRQISASNRKCGYDAARTEEKPRRGDLMTYWLPCWDDSKGGPRYVVRTDRATEARLAKVAAEQCIGLFPASIERSPFAQREAIEEIVPHRLGTSVVGAHIVFKRIPGLTVSWMRRAIACHQARWRTLGEPADYLPGDPTLIDGAEVTVTSADYRVVVLVETRSEPEAQVVLRRAKDLIAEQFARRP